MTHDDSKTLKSGPTGADPLTPNLVELATLHDLPSIQQLVEAVREWMERDVLTSTTGRVQFHTRVAINALAMVERELEMGSSQLVRHQEQLADIGYANDTELAAAIRRGDADCNIDQVVNVVRAAVVDKLAVANPGYFAAGDR